jgi:hypothetical protein
MPRKIRTVGSDGAFDALMLSGQGHRQRHRHPVEPGSSMGKSKAAQEAKIMDMFATGIIQDPSMALRLLEVGGVQKVQDTLATAEKKAQRENMKMKMLKPQDLQAALAQHQQEVQAHLMQDPEAGQMMQDPAVLQDRCGTSLRRCCPGRRLRCAREAHPRAQHVPHEPGVRDAAALR